MGLRGHQQALETLYKEVAAGTRSWPWFVGAHVCCGGGKSPLAVMAAHYLIERLKIVNKACWVVPNGSLREQGADAFLADKWMAKYLGHRLKFYECANTQNPCKDGTGYLTTYQALTCDRNGINRQEFERESYLLILDEGHHLAVGSETARAVEPLYRRAKAVLWLSGQIDRADEKMIFPLDYTHDGFAITTSSDKEYWIRYGLRQAMREHAIIEVHFNLSDASTKWTKAGHSSSAETLGESREALFTALHTEYASTLLAEGLSHFLSYERLHPGSRLLVVCANVRQARAMCDLAKKNGWPDAAIATYDHEDADKTISDFRKKPSPKVLFTVAKAYEGLDNLWITHLVCLTHIRSRQWIEQMIARGWRFNSEAGAWENQRCYIWAPSDIQFRECTRHIVAEQQKAAREAAEENGVRGGNGSAQRDYDPITPDWSSLKETIGTVLGGEEIAADETRIYASAAQLAGLQYLSPIEVKRLLEAVDRERHNGVIAAVASAPLRTPTQEWTLLRRDLDANIGAAARALCGDDASGASIGMAKRDINTDVFRQWGEREAMTPDQLREAIAWVRQRHGIQ